MMGAILGRPVELVACETVPLHVPASAEIVVDGFVDPDPATFADEGPFAEYPGYLDGHVAPTPVLRGSLEGMRPGFLVEDSMVNYARSAIAWNVLEGLGVRGVTEVWMSPVSNGTNLVVRIHKAYRGHAQQVAAALWGTSGSIWFYKNVMVVEEDIASRSWEFEPRPEWNGRHYPAVNTIAPALEARIAARWDEYGIGIPYLDDQRRELLTMEQLSKRLPDVWPAAPVHDWQSPPG